MCRPEVNERLSWQFLGVQPKLFPFTRNPVKRDGQKRGGGGPKGMVEVNTRGGGDQNSDGGGP